MQNGVVARPSVLVVDDVRANLVAMRAVLEPLDVEVVDASSGLEALARAAERTFALALIDVQMPGMDGFELARKLRERPESKELPIIFVSAVHRDDRYVREGYAAGAADYLTKPLDVHVLRARVRAFVDLFRQRERLRVAQVGLRTRERDEALEQLAELLKRERAARHEAELANVAKDEFIAIASHELRTPLTSVLGWAVMAQRMTNAADLMQALQTIERNARTQKRLIDDLLDMTRSMTGKLPLELGDIRVDDTVMSVVSMLNPAAEKRGVRVEVNVEPATLRADANRLKQIVTNLVGNAIKFTPRGGTVMITARRHAAYVRISVQDTGEGISPDLLPHLFEPFRQADTSPARAHGGLGLGLAIVKQLVEAHGGSVRAESPGLGRGATFVVELPLVARVPDSADAAQ